MNILHFGGLLFPVHIVKIDPTFPCFLGNLGISYPHGKNSIIPFGMELNGLESSQAGIDTGTGMKYIGWGLKYMGGN